jgi:hypothetical protein
MTEGRRTWTGEGIFANYPSETCIMGAATESPCPRPAIDPVPGWEDETPMLCAFHAAQEPLVDEVNELGVALEKLEAYLNDAREIGAGEQLVRALERIHADFSGRLEIAQRVLEDLDEAHRIMRG